MRARTLVLSALVGLGSLGVLSPSEVLAGRWYRDGRYWDRRDYERRYYGRNRDSYRDDDDFLKGAAVGAIIVGVAAAVANSDD